MLTSTRNPKIQHIRALQARARSRREAGEFVIEGVRLAEDALAAGLHPRTVFHTESLGPRGQAVLERFREQKTDLIPVSAAVMQAASDTKTPPGLLAVLPIDPIPLPPHPGLLLILDGVRDPGNLGTILRTAAAAGADGALLAPGTADPYAPKVVRAGMGAHFRLAIQPLTWGDIRAHTRALNLFLSDARAEMNYTAADYREPLALVIGGEAQGAAPEVRQLNPAGVRIPMPGGTESLNAAVAAGILLFEVVRQRES